jgi:hypothetical protein
MKLIYYLVFLAFLSSYTKDSNNASIHLIQLRPSIFLAIQVEVLEPIRISPFDPYCEMTITINY